MSKLKLNRNKFFKYTGTALLGAVAFSYFPFNMLKAKSPKEKSSLKITVNPNSIQRKSERKVNG